MLNSNVQIAPHVQIRKILVIQCVFCILFWIEETILNLGLSWGEQREDFARNASPADSIFFFHSNGSILGHWQSANHFCGTCRFSQDALRCVFSWNLLIGLFFNVLDLDFKIYLETMFSYFRDFLRLLFELFSIVLGVSFQGRLNKEKESQKSFSLTKFKELSFSKQSWADSLVRISTGPPSKQRAQPVAVKGFWTVWKKRKWKVSPYQCRFASTSLRYL